MSNTMALHVRYNCWHISLPFPVKQRREMTKFCVHMYMKFKNVVLEFYADCVSYSD